MQIPPLSVLESWPAANYVDPVTRGPANIIITCIFFPLACAFIAIRVYTRLRISESFGADDWLILASLFPTIAYSIISLLSDLHFKWNRHIWDVPVDTLPLALKMGMTLQLLYAIASSLIKCSMLALTHRVVGTGSRKLQKTVSAVFCLVAFEAFLFLFVVVFQCRPASAFWTLSVAPQKCISQTAHLLVAGIVNTITDLLVVTLPIPCVWGLQLPRRQQITLAVLFGIGFTATFAGIIRTAYTYKLTTSYDQTWMKFPVWISCSIELYLGVICASVPPTRKFFSRYIPRLLGTTPLSKSKSKITNPTKDSHISSSNLGGEYLEMGKMNEAADQKPLPPEPEKSESTVRVKVIESIFNVNSGRARTADSRNSVGTDGSYNLRREESEDELV